MANINPFNIEEKTIKERQQNKGELYRIEGLLFYLEKSLKEETIKAQNKESAVLLNNIATYLKDRHSIISNREKEIEEILKQKTEENNPKTFI